MNPITIYAFFFFTAKPFSCASLQILRWAKNWVGYLRGKRGTCKSEDIKPGEQATRYEEVEVDDVSEDATEDYYNRDEPPPWGTVKLTTCKLSSPLKQLATRPPPVPPIALTGIMAFMITNLHYCSLSFLSFITSTSSTNP